MMEYELEYSLIDKEQAKEFSYNITGEIINDYIKTHQEEFNKWKDLEYLKDIIKKAMNIKLPVNIKNRMILIKTLKGGN